ncbi:MAG: TetR/AcrR family transcriptional regulator [Saprospiraceae bacterium]|nr:TetR/AcrR family transcriptional regulator [Saprospiraceae bacterium]
MPQINITIDINESIYLRDPLETNLGKKIIEHAILLIDEIGFEELNFKKIATSMGSTEASIYRYFENKYKLLSYLVSWYWDFMHFMVLMDIRNVKDSKAKLVQAISTLVNSLDSSITPSYINQTKLHKVVVENANKVYHTKKVDSLNKEGYYVNYKKIVKTLSKMILEIDSEFEYPIALATNLIEQSLNNEYYIEHLPSLTDVTDSKANPRIETIKMIEYMISRILY